MITLKVSKDEALDNLNEAQTKLEGAIHLLRQTFDDEYVRSYILAPLEIIAGANHEWVSRDPNLDGLREQVEELEEPEPDPDAYYAQQEREHWANFDAIEDEREVQAFFDENEREPSPARPETMWDHLIHLSDPVVPDDFSDSLAGQTLLQLGAQTAIDSPRTERGEQEAGVSSAGLVDENPFSVGYLSTAEMALNVAKSLLRTTESPRFDGQMKVLRDTASQLVELLSALQED